MLHYLVCKKNFSSSFSLTKTIQSRNFCSIIQTPTERYNLLAKEGKIQHDKNQIPVLDKLDALYHQLTKNPSTPAKGIYIYGEVGSGKTFLMDLFYQCLPKSVTKRRDHYDQFMKDLHKRMWKKSRTMKGKSADAFPVVVDEIVAESKVLCFDEFQLPDVGSAVLLSNMLRQAISKELVLITTSNLSPKEVCTRGLHHNRIGDFFELIQDKCEVVHLNSTRDYRVPIKDKPVRGKRYFYPLDGGNKQVLNFWNHFTKRRTIIPNESISQRLSIPKSAMLSNGSRVALFDYADLIVKPYGVNDYRLIAETYEFVFITNVPKFTLQNKNEAKRFISLVDQMYDLHAKLIFAAEVPITQLFDIRTMDDKEFDRNLDLAEDKLSHLASSKNSNAGVWMEDFKHDGVSLSNVYTSGRAEKFASARTVSRLQEMSSDEYWGLGNRDEEAEEDV